MTTRHVVIHAERSRLRSPGHSVGYFEASECVACGRYRLKKEPDHFRQPSNVR